nr:hypothetical protein [Tanacetum cinerariifolium]
MLLTRIPRRIPKEDFEDDPVDYPADGGDDNDDESSNDDEVEDEHLAPVDSVVVPAVDHVPSSEETEPFEMDESAAPIPFPSEVEVERLLALLIPPPSPLISLSPPFAEERLARCLTAPVLPSPPHPIIPHLCGSPNHILGKESNHFVDNTLITDYVHECFNSVDVGWCDKWILRSFHCPNHVRAPRGFRAAMDRLRASSPSAHHPLHPSPPLPPLPSSLYLPPPVPT